jgi:dienelactone hydrolase
MTASTQAGAALVRVPVGDVVLEGELVLPQGATGIVTFAHGSGSGRHSPRNRQVAATLNRAGIATLLVDLLTGAEEKADRATGEYRFDIDLLARRLAGTVGWVRSGPAAGLEIGLFGASTGGAAALVVAAELPDDISAVVSRGGRPDLAAAVLPNVRAPTLLIVGAHDKLVLDLNRRALELVGASVKKLVVVPGATHLFEEPGALEQVAQLAVEWFAQFLTGHGRAS